MISSIGHNTGPVRCHPTAGILTTEPRHGDIAPYAVRRGLGATRRQERGRGQRLHRLGPLAPRSVVTVCPDQESGVLCILLKALLVVDCKLAMRDVRQWG
jgi:hypothetical protein